MTARSIVMAAATGSLPAPPTLDLNFMIPATLPPGVTFTRSSIARYFDVTGVMQTAALNAPRWDYDPITHVLRGILIEESRTNIIFNSQFDAIWTVGGSVLTANTVTSPDGTTSAATLREDATTGLHYTLQSITKSASIQTYAISIFAKPGSGTRNLQIQLDDGGSNGVLMVVNPTTGAVVTNPSSFGTGWSGTPVTFISLINGWKRFSFTITTSAATTIRTIVQQVNGTIGNYAGDNTSNIQIYGYQIELGSFATSYIPTTGATFTRAIDVCTMPVGVWYNQTNNSCVVESMSPVSWSGANNWGYIEVNDSPGTTARLALYEHPQITVLNRVASATVWNANLSSAIIPLVVTKAGWAASSSALSISWNGGAPITDPHSIASVMTNVQIGCLLSNAQQRNGWMRRIRFWPRTLPNVELQLNTQ